MLIESTKKKYKYYRALLEGVGEQTNTEAFYSVSFQKMYNLSNPNEFGHVIVKKTPFGYYEVITGIKLPVIKLKANGDASDVLITPKSSYRLRNLTPVDDCVLENYKANNNTIQFKLDLMNFLSDSDISLIEKHIADMAEIYEQCTLEKKK